MKVIKLLSIILLVFNLLGVSAVAAELVASSYQVTDNQDVSCTYVGANNPVYNFHFYWYKDGSSTPSYNSIDVAAPYNRDPVSTLPASVSTPGNWKCKVFFINYDNSEYHLNTLADNIVVVSTGASYAGLVAITPSNPQDNSNLVGTLQGANLPVYSYRMVWYKDGSTTPYKGEYDVAQPWNRNPISTILASETSIGDIWTLVVSYTDASYADHEIGRTSVVILAVQPSVVVTPGALIVSIAANPTTVVAGSSVVFSSTVSGGLSPYTYLWNFGDSTTGNGASVSHTYSAQGSYNAVLTVIDSSVPVLSGTSSVTISATTTTNISITFSTNSCPDAEEGLVYTCDIDATGIGILQYSLLGEPSGMTIDQNSGLISWTPSSAGDFTFTVRITDITNLLSRDQLFTITVDEAEVTNEFVFIDSIVFEKETYSPGETAVAYVTVRNEDDNDVDDLKIELLMVDSGVTAVSSEFDLMSNGKKTIAVSLDLPNEIFASSEWIKFTLIGENIRIARYRALEFSGASSVFSAKSGPSELIFKPTSLPGYSAGNGVNDLNWSGIWFMILLLLLLLGVAAYIVKGMAEEKNKKDSFNSLDNNYFGEN